MKDEGRGGGPRQQRCLTAAERAQLRPNRPVREAEYPEHIYRPAALQFRVARPVWMCKRERIDRQRGELDQGNEHQCDECRVPHRDAHPEERRRDGNGEQQRWRDEERLHRGSRSRPVSGVARRRVCPERPRRRQFARDEAGGSNANRRPVSEHHRNPQYDGARAHQRGDVAAGDA